jgi:hypothetical protein
MTGSYSRVAEYLPRIGPQLRLDGTPSRRHFPGMQPPEDVNVGSAAAPLGASTPFPPSPPMNKAVALVWKAAAADGSCVPDAETALGFKLDNTDWPPMPTPTAAAQGRGLGLMPGGGGDGRGGNALLEMRLERALRGIPSSSELQTQEPTTTNPPLHTPLPIHPQPIHRPTSPLTAPPVAVPSDALSSLGRVSLPACAGGAPTCCCDGRSGGESARCYRAVGRDAARGTRSR